MDMPPLPFDPEDHVPDYSELVDRKQEVGTLIEQAKDLLDNLRTEDSEIYAGMKKHREQWTQGGPCPQCSTTTRPNRSSFAQSVSFTCPSCGLYHSYYD